MPLPDNIIPFKQSAVDDYGRLWIGRGYSGHQIVVRFNDDPELHYVDVLESGRANVGRGFKGRECDVYVLRYAYIP